METKLETIAKALEKLNLANATVAEAMRQWREASDEICKLLGEKQAHDAALKARHILANWAMNKLAKG